MCARFENKETGESIFIKISKDAEGKFILDKNISEIKKVNIAPTNEIITVSKEENHYKISSMNWGIQFYKEKKTPVIFNSRIETIKEKFFWTNLFYKNRCLIPATAFYEWKEINSVKIPHRIFLKKFDIFFFAGIYSKTDDIKHASLITSQPNLFMNSIHARMPVILTKEKINQFLNGQPEEALKLCSPLENKIEMDIEIAGDLLTEKQKKHLNSK